MHPLPRERALLVAEDAQGLCGTVQLVLDAVTDGDRGRLYERLGWSVCG